MVATVEKNSAALVELSKELAASKRETDTKIAETDAKIAETVAQIATSKRETDAKMAAAAAKMAEMEASIAETNAEFKRSLKESMDRMSRSDEEFKRSLQESMDRMSSSDKEFKRSLKESMDRLSRNIGDVNNRFGEIIELVVLPGLLEEMNTQCGHKFDNVSPRKRFTDSGREYAEIDLFLENGESVMAVEAKARFTLGMAHEFIRQVESLREHEAKAGVVGKTIYAAIAGIGIDAAVRAFASENGLYLVDVDNSNCKVSIEPPKGTVKKW
jgi:hypothetical protein